MATIPHAWRRTGRVCPNPTRMLSRGRLCLNMPTENHGDGPEDYIRAQELLQRAFDLDLNRAPACRRAVASSGPGSSVVLMSANQSNFLATQSAVVER